MANGLGVDEVDGLELELVTLVELALPDIVALPEGIALLSTVTPVSLAGLSALSGRAVGVGIVILRPDEVS